MPLYPATLQHIPAPIQESVILTFGRQLKISLQNVHQKDQGHNDFKAASVFISATGEQQPIMQFVCVHAVFALFNAYLSSVCMQVNAYLGTLALL